MAEYQGPLIIIITYTKMFLIDALVVHVSLHDLKVTKPGSSLCVEIRNVFLNCGKAPLEKINFILLGEHF